MKKGENNSYGSIVANARYGRFLVLLAKWRSSVYKLLYRDFLVFVLIYFGLTCLYLYGLDGESKKTFEAIVVYCREQNSLTLLSLILGFYVGVIIQRWWDQYMSTPWPDPIAVFVSCLVQGNDNYGRVMRRTVMRYLCLTLCMVMTRISPPAKKSFPSYQKLIDAGMLMPSERDIMKKLEDKFPKLSLHWIPIVWACSILVRGRTEGRIRDDFALRTLIDAINNFRSYCHTLLQYDFISIPLVYTQVATLVVYTYFIGSLMGRQYIHPHGDAATHPGINYYFPIFPLMEFFFYLGWLKVAEVIICPFGEDDQDFDVIWFIERNLQICYIIVDEMYHKHPELLKDQYWNSISPDTLPYPKMSTTIVTGITSLFTRKAQRLPEQSSFELEIHKLAEKERQHRLRFGSDSTTTPTPPSSSSEENRKRKFEKIRRKQDELGKSRQPRNVTSDELRRLREERDRARYGRPSFQPGDTESASSFEIIGAPPTRKPSTDTSGRSESTIYNSFEDSNVPVTSSDDDKLLATPSDISSRVTLEDVPDDEESVATPASTADDLDDATLVEGEEGEEEEEEDEEILNILHYMRDYRRNNQQ